MTQSSFPAAVLRSLKRLIGADEALLSQRSLHLSAVDMRRIKQNIAFCRLQLAAVRHGVALRKYDPHQPRVPAGSSDGGQWTSGESGGGWSGSVSLPTPTGEPTFLAGEPTFTTDTTGMEPWKSVATAYDDDGAISQEAVSMRDGSYIRSSFADADESTSWDERHTVVLPDGPTLRFETAGNIQTVKDANGQTLAASAWTSAGAIPEAFVQPAFAPSPDPRVAAIVIAATTLYTWMSSRNTADEKAVFAFNASAFVPGADPKQPAIWVGKLTHKEVADACPRFADVQSLADQSVALINRGSYTSAATYGTAVHKWIQDEINGPPTTPARPPRDPNFRAEVSLIKSRLETFGKLGSIRIDVYENPRTGTVCVYDIKTGDKGLSPLRALEIASNVQTFYPGTQKIIVTETRPRR
jgi:hypothetical protein